MHTPRNKRWVIEVPGWKKHCLCKTPDDWYPTRGGKVKLSVLKLSSGTRICVWGGDDFGLEKDQPISMAEAFKEADAIPVPITQAWLREHGFVNA